MSHSHSHHSHGSDQTRLWVFLVLNFIFMFAEIIYGVLTNSLALISDAFHMVFDCLSLLVSLYAMHLSSKPPSSTFTFGLVRTEIFAAFVNSVLLLFVSAFLLIEGFLRVLSPPDVTRLPELLTVAILGLLVNLVGVFSFSHHSHAGCQDDSHHHNMKGVFLHVLADTLGSVGVVIACVTVMKKGWMMADPLVSLGISFLISSSAIPLLKSSSKSLLLINPESVERSSVERAINTVHDVVQVVDLRFWELVAGKE
ncbi:hypothetical protein GEMRC1_001583 [Eukaryota sp. GEM-RC1]